MYVSSPISCAMTRTLTRLDTVFLHQFVQYRNPGKYRPPKATIEHVWSRTLRHQTYSSAEQSELPKGMAMAVIYMLHVETNAATESERPPFEQFLRNGFQRLPERTERERCKRFDKWVPCVCEGKCNTRWNFVNDDGLCSEEGNQRACRIIKLRSTNTSKATVVSSTKRVLNALEKMRAEWWAR